MSIVDGSDVELRVVLCLGKASTILMAFAHFHCFFDYDGTNSNIALITHQFATLPLLIISVLYS